MQKQEPWFLKPAVINPPDIFHQLKTGDMVEVDGFRSQVTLIENTD